MVPVQYLPPCNEPPPNILMNQRRVLWRNMNVPPPGVPAALGSKMYPIEELRFNKEIPIPSQMREKSMARLKQEDRAFVQNKLPGYKQFRRQNGHTENYCSICSETDSYVHEEMTVVTHKHHSSLQTRLDAHTDYWAEYECNSCKEHGKTDK